MSMISEHGVDGVEDMVRNASLRMIRWKEQNHDSEKRSLTWFQTIHYVCRTHHLPPKADPVVE
jgi:hypothetical protein